jgi:hypothetical protein
MKEAVAWERSAREAVAMVQRALEAQATAMQEQVEQVMVQQAWAVRGDPFEAVAASSEVAKAGAGGAAGRTSRARTLTSNTITTFKSHNVERAMQR